MQCCIDSSTPGLDRQIYLNSTGHCLAEILAWLPEALINSFTLGQVGMMHHSDTAITLAVFESVHLQTGYAALPDVDLSFVISLPSQPRYSSNDPPQAGPNFARAVQTTNILSKQMVYSTQNALDVFL